MALKLRAKLFFFFFFWVLIFNFWVNFHRPAVKLDDFKGQMKAGNNSEWGLYAYWTETGDFEDWYVMGGSYAIFDDTGDHLWCRCDATDDANISRDLTNTSCGFVRDYSFYYHVYSQYASPTYLQYFEMRIYYVDASYDVLKSVIINETPFEWTEWINGTLTSSKTVDYIWVNIEIGASGYLSFYLYDEVYFGYLPYSSNENMQPTQPKVNQEIVFSCDVMNTSFISLQNVALNLIYISTMKSHVDLMKKEWQSDYFYSINTSLTKEGAYCFFISVYLSGWEDAVKDSPIYYFNVYGYDDLVYPAKAKLTLWEPTGLVIPTNLKVFLGDSETYELFNPLININPDWTPYTGNVSGRYVSYYVEEHKLYLNTVRNGVKINCSDANGLYPNVSHYESLVFDVRVRSINTSSLQYIILGINQWTADYYLSFDVDYLNQWVQYIIPFPRFTWRVESDALAELCFYGHFNLELKNIFVADYKEMATILNNSANITSDYDVSDTSYNSSIHVFPGNSTQTSASTWNNVSSYRLETNFNVSNFQSENITIVDNQTVQLNQTGNFKAEFSFTDDTIGENPTGWEVTEPSSCSIDVIALQGIHSKVVEFDDQSSSDKPRMDDDFASSHSTGTVEWWAQVSTNSVTSYVMSIEDTDDSNRLGSVAFFSDGNIKVLNGGSWEAVTTYAADTWYHFRVEFDAADDWHLWIDCVSMDEGSGYAFYGTPSTATRFYIGGTDSGIAKCYLDAVDYSWSSGYYTYRSFNNTYFAGGYYQSPTYNLGSANYQWYYETLEFTRALGTDTNLTLEYATSQDNLTWIWSSAFISNQTINANKTQFWKFRVNLTNSGNETFTPFCTWVNLTYVLQSAIVHYNECVLVTTFTKAKFWRGVQLIVNLSLSVSKSFLINSSIALWNFDSSEYDNKSAFCYYDSGNLSNSYFNATNHVQLKISAYCNVSFQYDFVRSDLNSTNWQFTKLCYIEGNVSAYGNAWNITIFQYSFNVSDYEGNSRLYLYFVYENSSVILYDTYICGDNLSEQLYISNMGEISLFKWKFVFDSGGNDINLSVLINKFYMIGAKSYRLISEANRQGKEGDNALEFDTAYECLCLTDYYNTVVYKSWINRTLDGYYIDVMLSFWEVTFSNFMPDTLVSFNVTNRNLNITVTLPYGASTTLGLFTNDYVVVAYNEENKIVISTWNVVISRSKNRQFQVSEPIPVTPGNPRTVGWEAFVESNWFVFILVGIAVLIIIYAGRQPKTINNYYVTKKEKKDVFRIKKKEEKKFRM